jgi:hypothetical protein
LSPVDGDTEELLAFLESSLYISERDVTPLLYTLYPHGAFSIIHLLENYEQQVFENSEIYSLGYRKWNSLAFIFSMESAEKFNKIMSLSSAEREVSDQNGLWDLFSYYTAQSCWAIVVFHVGRKVDIGKQLHWAKTRWITDINCPILIYEYNETDNVLKIPSHIITSSNDKIMSCSSDIVGCAKKMINKSPRDYLKDIEENSPFQVNTHHRFLKHGSLQVQVLEELQPKMSATVFTDLTKGVASILMLLKELPAKSYWVTASYKLDTSIEEVNLKVSNLQPLCGYIVRWDERELHGISTIECRTSLSKFLNIFISFMNATQKKENYLICGFKLIDMWMGAMYVVRSYFSE